MPTINIMSELMNDSNVFDFRIEKNNTYIKVWINEKLRKLDSIYPPNRVSSEQHSNDVLREAYVKYLKNEEMRDV